MKTPDAFLTACGTIDQFIKEYQFGRDGRPRFDRSQFARSLGIEPGRFQERLDEALDLISGRLAAPRRRTNRPIRQQFERAARAIQQDPDGVLSMVCRGESALSPSGLVDPHALMQLAVEEASGEDVADAVVLARHAILLSKQASVEDSLRLLPQALYLHHRHASPVQLVKFVRRDIGPMLRFASHFRLPRMECAAAIGQLACVLNEMGRHDLAVAVFELKSVSDLLERGDGSLNWCGPMLLRNWAHAVAWDNGGMNHAMQLIDQAVQRDPTVRNKQSVANSKCEIQFHARDYRAAWQLIEPHYVAIKEQLAEREAHSEMTLPGDVLPRFQSSFGSFYIALLTRVAMSDGSYTKDAQSRDLTLLDFMLDVDGSGSAHRPMLHGGVVSSAALAVQGKAKQPEQLARINRIVLKPRLDDAAVNDICELISILRERGHA